MSTLPMPRYVRDPLASAQERQELRRRVDELESKREQCRESASCNGAQAADSCEAEVQEHERSGVSLTENAQGSLCTGATVPTSTTCLGNFLS